MNVSASGFNSSFDMTGIDNFISCLESRNLKVEYQPNSHTIKILADTNLEFVANLLRSFYNAELSMNNYEYKYMWIPSLKETAENKFEIPILPYHAGISIVNEHYWRQMGLLYPLYTKNGYPAFLIENQIKQTQKATEIPSENIERDLCDVVKKELGISKFDIPVLQLVEEKLKKFDHKGMYNLKNRTIRVVESSKLPVTYFQSLFMNYSAEFTGKSFAPVPNKRENSSKDWEFRLLYTFGDNASIPASKLVYIGSELGPEPSVPNVQYYGAEYFK